MSVWAVFQDGRYFLHFLLYNTNTREVLDYSRFVCVVTISEYMTLLCITSSKLLSWQG